LGGMDNFDERQKSLSSVVYWLGLSALVREFPFFQSLNNTENAHPSGGMPIRLDGINGERPRFHVPAVSKDPIIGSVLRSSKAVTWFETTRTFVEVTQPARPSREFDQAFAERYGSPMNPISTVTIFPYLKQKASPIIYA